MLREGEKAPFWPGLECRIAVIRINMPKAVVAALNSWGRKHKGVLGDCFGSLAVICPQASAAEEMPPSGHVGIGKELL